MSVAYRVRQAVNHAFAGNQAPPAIPDEAARFLNEPMTHQFRILSPTDQRHLLAVFHYLIAQGADRETAIAGLIHDVGKGCMKCSITLLDRTAHVLLGRFAPGLYRRFASREIASERLRALHRLATHPERGALAAQQAGYSDRVVWLVRHHESGGDPNDAALRLLREADHVAGACS
jgi:hypothetical protein